MNVDSWAMPPPDPIDYSGLRTKSERNFRRDVLFSETSATVKAVAEFLADAEYGITPTPYFTLTLVRAVCLGKTDEALEIANELVKVAGERYADLEVDAAIDEGHP